MVLQNGTKKTFVVRGLMISKIAIMILVHKNEEQVNRLIKHLSKDFDIYVHIDKRFSIKTNAQSNVFFYKKYETCWGSFNLIAATLLLLREARKKNYERYILISGQDLPIKTNKEIKNFFENNDSEYIDIEKMPRKDGSPDMKNCLQYYHQNYKYGEKEIKYRIFYRFLRKIFYIMNKYIPRKLDYDFYGGAQWFNITKNNVDKIFEYIKYNKKYIKRYKWTLCTDELFFHTIIHQINGINIKNNCLRYIDWKSGPEYPRILRINDYEKIMDGGNIFARKFDIVIDNEIVDKIYNTIKEDIDIW